MEAAQLRELARDSAAPPLEWSRPADSTGLRLRLTACGVVTLPADCPRPAGTDPPPATRYEVEWSYAGRHWRAVRLTPGQNEAGRFELGTAEKLGAAMARCESNWRDDQARNVVADWINRVSEVAKRRAAFAAAREELDLWQMLNSAA